MAHHVLEMPAGEDAVRQLRVGDTVTLEKTLFGIRDATLIAMFDRGARTRLDLKGHAVVHTAPNVKPVEPSAENPAQVCADLCRHDDIDAHGEVHAAADGAGGRADHRGQGRHGSREPRRVR